MRVSSPGKAMRVPIRMPAAPASAIANSSVVPWMVSQPPSSKPSPFDQ